MTIKHYRVKETISYRVVLEEERRLKGTKYIFSLIFFKISDLKQLPRRQTIRVFLLQLFYFKPVYISVMVQVSYVPAPEYQQKISLTLLTAIINTKHPQGFQSNVCKFRYNMTLSKLQLTTTQTHTTTSKQHQISYVGAQRLWPTKGSVPGPQMMLINSSSKH